MFRLNVLMINLTRLINIPKSDALLDEIKLKCIAVTAYGTVTLEELWLDFLLAVLLEEPITKNKKNIKTRLLLQNQQKGLPFWYTCINLTVAHCFSHIVTIVDMIVIVIEISINYFCVKQRDIFFNSFCYIRE